MLNSYIVELSNERPPLIAICGLIKCLIDRAYKINKIWAGFHDDLLKIKDILAKNFYPSPISLTNILNHIYIRHMTGDSAKDNTNNTCYFNCFS